VIVTGANVSGTANVSTLVVTGNQTSLGNVAITGNISANIATFGAGSNTAPAITTTGDTNTGIFFPAADTIAFSEGGTEAMRLDSAGNMGLGVTPSAWGSTYRMQQIGLTASIGGRTAASQAYLSANWYTDGTNNRYITSAAATQYQQDAGVHYWFTAASGTAGNTISFTQAMTLDASGNLGIGTTSPAYPLDVVANSNAWTGNLRGRSADNIGYLRFSSNNNATTYAAIGTPSANTLGFDVNGVERARITSGGDLLVGGTTVLGASRITSYNAGNCHFATRNTSAASGRYWRYEVDSGNTIYIINHDSTGVYISNGGTGWTGLSDERYKDIIEPITGAAEKVASLRAVIGKFKTDEDGKRRAFLIAQDVQAVLPEAVDASNPERLGVTQTDVIPLLVAAIKEQQALITQLQADVAALKGTA
jgi:hypothetical protein